MLPDTRIRCVRVCALVVRLCFLFALNPRTEALKSMLHFLQLSLCRRERICNERRRRLHTADLCSLLWQFFSMLASVWPAPLCWILIKINYIKSNKQTANGKQKTSEISDISAIGSRANGWVIAPNTMRSPGNVQVSVSDAVKALAESSPVCIFICCMHAAFCVNFY